MLNTETNNSFQKKELLVTSAVIALCLILSIAFPSKGTIQDLTKALFFLVVLPVLYIKLVIKKNVGDFGLNLRNKRSGIVWGLSMLVISLLTVFLLARYTNFSENYALPSLAVESFGFFLINLLVFYNLLLFIQEYFFRGFILSALASRISFWSVFIQAGVYFVAVVITQGGFQKELWQLAPMIILSVTGGVTAYKSHSMVYSYLSGLAFLIAMQAYLIHAIKTS